MNIKIKKILKGLGITVIVFFVIYFVFGFVLTTINQHLLEQSQFTETGYRGFPPNGDYDGRAVVTLNWIGKSFDSLTDTGNNRFQVGNAEYKAVEFRTYEGKGLTDPNTNVLKIDYDVPQNPFFYKWILDEITETGQGNFLGKVQFRMIPFFPITLFYFRLDKKVELQMEPAQN